MRVSRRSLLSSGLTAAGASLLPVGARRAFAQQNSLEIDRSAWGGGAVTRSHGDSLVGDLKYPPDFTHFEYVNVDAPKGGEARRADYGRFDNLNPYIVRGTAPTHMLFYWEPLMRQPFDENASHYGLIAEWMEKPEDASWAAFRLRDEARFSDGTPVTVDDVLFSLEMFKTKATPRYVAYYQNVVEAVDEGDRVVRFVFDGTGNRELPHIVGQIDIMPAHWFADRDFEQALTEAPPTTGPYVVGDYEVGRYIEFNRVEDYWAADLPVMRGYANFDRYRVVYFGAPDIAFESMKTNGVDFWRENSARRWAEGYDFPAFESGEVVKIEPTLERPQVVQFFALNARKPLFSDRRVREAFALCFDFESANEQVYFGQYARPRSFFQGTPSLMPEGPPSPEEVALLEPFRDQLPERLFAEQFENPVGGGRRALRANLGRGAALLEEAGYRVEQGALIAPNGEPVSVEFLLRSASSSQEAVIQPFLDNLGRLGVDARIRTVDDAQYVERLTSYDFDMAISAMINSTSPGNEQRDYWGSSTATRPGSRNLAGVSSPVVDALIEAIIFAPDRAALETASRALDRVLLWEHYVIPQLYTPYERIAYWSSRVTPPDPLPSGAIGFPDVWWAAEA